MSLSKMESTVSASPTLYRLRAVVRGHVQGVGFRFWAHHTARELALIGGQVHNLPDGSVEVEAEAHERAPLETLFHALHLGPTAAQVTAVEADWEEAADAAPRYQNFRVID